MSINNLTEKDIKNIDDIDSLKNLLNESVKKIRKLNNKNCKLNDKLYELNKDLNNTWIHRIDYLAINNYILNLFSNIDYDCNSELCNFVIEDYNDAMKKFYNFYDLISAYKSGRYSDTYIIKNKNDNKLCILRNTIIKTHEQFIDIFKEIFIQKYCNKKLNIAPEIYDLKLLNKDNKIYLSIIMKRLKTTFFKHFKINKVYKSFIDNDNKIFKDLNEILPTLVGNIEYIIINNVSHNDTHDENICFDYDGKMYIIDYDNANIINNNEKKDTENCNIKILFKHLKHFISTYFYFKCHYVYDKKKMDILYENTFLKKIIDKINDGTYVFGECIIFKDSKITYK